jgi:retron-type reverse transcriptase
MPKKYNNLWNTVASFENLVLSFSAASKGKKERVSVLKFKSQLEENIINIQNNLIWKTWRPGEYRSFFVYEPKHRLVQAPCFEDRVVHHALIDVIEPLFDKKFIKDSYACRRGKGIHNTSVRLQQFLRSAGSGGRKVYVLKADISKYFPSINHGKLISIIKKTVKDPDVLWLCDKIIKHYGYEKRGLPVGALTSQLFANVYLDQFDHFIKDELGIKYYLRYMDDFVILAHDKKVLWELLAEVESFLAVELSLSLNPKTSIFPASKGVDFAGYRVWPTHILPRKAIIKNSKTRFKKLSRLYASGKCEAEHIKPRVASFLGYMKHCSSKKTVGNILKDFVLTRNHRG